MGNGNIIRIELSMWTLEWSDYLIIAQHPQAQHRHMLLKYPARQYRCHEYQIRPQRLPYHPNCGANGSMLLMLTFIRLYWSSCIDIDTQMHHPSTSRGKVSIILKSIMTECSTLDHMSVFFFQFCFLCTLTNSLGFCFITKRMQSLNHPAFHPRRYRLL